MLSCNRVLGKQIFSLLTIQSLEVTLGVQRGNPKVWSNKLHLTEVAMACLNCILFGDRSREIESSTDRMIFTYSIHTFLSKLKELIMFISLWKEALYKLRKIYLNLHHAIFFSNECCVLRVTSKQFLCVCCCWVWMNVWRGCRCPCENTENFSK